MSSVAESFQRIEKQRERIMNGDTPVGPGQEQRFSPANQPGEALRQGDLYLTLLDAVPEGFTKRTNGDLRLVPGGDTEGSRHILSANSECEVFDPPGWSFDASYDAHTGPVLVCKGETTVEHPRHGNVIGCADQIIGMGYQKDYDTEQARIRRQRD